MSNTNEEPADTVAAVSALRIEPTYEYLKSHNPSNDKPYHNLFHTQCMIKNCYAGARAEGLSEHDTRVLVLAAIFHDWAHSAGMTNDSENIKRAIAAFDEYVKSNHDLIYNQYGMTDKDVENVKSIIGVTEFPYVRDAVTIQEQIIRDADLMQSYEDSWFEHIFNGLRSEFSNMFKRPMSLEDMIAVQLKFMRNVVWHTKWAQRRAQEGSPKTWAQALQQVEDLAKQHNVPH